MKAFVEKAKTEKERWRLFQEFGGRAKQPKQPKPKK
jgi:hypothetical protein